MTVVLTDDRGTPVPPPARAGGRCHKCNAPESKRVTTRGFGGHQQTNCLQCGERLEPEGEDQ